MNHGRKNWHLIRWKNMVKSSLVRPIRTLPYTIAIGLALLPIVQYFCKLSWDEATTAVAVPVALVYVCVRLFVAPTTAEEAAHLEADLAKARHEPQPQPLPTDITIVATAAILGVILGVLTLLAAGVYWLLALPFARTVALVDWRVMGKGTIYATAYIGFSMVIRWCMPLVRYCWHVVVDTVFWHRHRGSRASYGAGTGD